MGLEPTRGVSDSRGPHSVVIRGVFVLEWMVETQNYLGTWES